MADQRIEQLIRRSFSNDVVEVYRAYNPSKAEIEQLGAIGKEVLTHFPTLPGGCAVMSALFGFLAHDRMPNTPVFVAAGSLSVEGTPVFGNSVAKVDWNNVFGQSQFSWDGHCWVICGEYIADISLFRTAYSSKSPPALADFVRREFGMGRGLFIAKEIPGLEYVPQHILTNGQVSALSRGALALLEMKE